MQISCVLHWLVSDSYYIHTMFTVGFAWDMVIDSQHVTEQMTYCVLKPSGTWLLFHFAKIMSECQFCLSK